jgi:hypothetical protein
MFDGIKSAPDLNCVGLILQVDASGKVVVSGVAQFRGPPKLKT